MSACARRATAACCALALSGCGAGPGLPAVAPIGAGAAHRPGSLTRAVAAARPIGAMTCRARRPRAALAHVELFGDGLAVVVPAGLGVAPPRRREGAYVRGGACTYPLVTREPTGVVELAPGARATLGRLFALLGQPLSRQRMGPFGGPVRAWLGGREWKGALADLPLRARAQVVVAAGRGAVPVHARYGFPR
jgi:hypothetical protein